MTMIAVFCDADGRAIHFAQPIITPRGLELGPRCGSDTSTCLLSRVDDMGLWFACPKCQEQLDIYCGDD